MENLTSLYDSKGFIDQVPEPVTDIINSESRIDLIFRIDEGEPYRIANILIRSEDSSHKELQLPQSKGAFYSPDLWSRFCDHAKCKTEISFRNTVLSTVDIVVSFPACPSPESSAL